MIKRLCVKLLKLVIINFDTFWVVHIFYVIVFCSLLVIIMSSKAKPSSTNSLTVLKLSQSEFSEEPLDLADPPPNWLQDDGSVGALSVYNSQDNNHPSRYAWSIPLVLLWLSCVIVMRYDMCLSLYS